jgi:hypothetical protein
MYVFHYDPNTMAYTGNSPVDFCQREPGTVLVPAWASKNPPPPGWDSRTHLPYYLPAKDAWEVRALPVPAAEPPPPTDAEVLDRMQMLKQTLEAHLRAAGEIVVQLQETMPKDAA